MKKFRRNDWGIYILIWILCGVIFVIPISNADEVWNYNFAKAITDGLIPYTDINMIPTPLSSYVAAVFLMLFGKGLLAYRIAGFVLMGMTFAIYYTLSKRILQNVLFAFIATMMMWALNIYFYIYSYNTLSLFLVLLVLLLENNVHAGSNEWRLQIIIGVIFGLLPLIKQSTGVVLFLVNILICIANLKQKNGNRKAILWRLGVSVIPGIAFLLYLFKIATFEAFWDYAVMGIGTFSHRILIWNYAFASPMNGIIVLLLLTMIVVILYKLFVKKIGSHNQQITAVYVFAWLFAVAYPLCDEQHLFLGLIPLTVLFFSCINDSEKIKTCLFYFNLAVSTFIVVLLVCAGVKMENYKFCELHNYDGIPIESRFEEHIQIVCDFIKEQEEQGKKVYIANEYAAVYMIPLDKYTKNWDLLLVGNVGTANVNELLDIEANSVIMVLKDGFSLNRQAHFELINYVKENYILIDEVQNFDVYKKQD